MSTTQGQNVSEPAAAVENKDTAVTEAVAGVSVPEVKVADIHGREPVQKPENLVPSAPPLEPRVPKSLVPEADNTPIPLDMLAVAEQALATYIGNKLEVTKDQLFKLTLSTAPCHDGSELKLDLQTPLVASNPYLGAKVIAALKEHPVFAAVLTADHKPAYTKASEKKDTIEVHVPELSEAEYKFIVRSLAGVTANAALPATGSAVLADIAPAAAETAGPAADKAPAKTVVQTPALLEETLQKAPVELAV